MGHHTNDLSPLSLRRANPEQNPFAHRGLIGECFRSQCLINYEQIAVGRAVLLRESAPGNKLSAHGLEIPGQNDLKIGSLKLARIVLSLGSTPTHRTKPTG